MKKRSRTRLHIIGLYMHEKFEVHLLISSVINMISLIVVVGIFEMLKYPLIKYQDIMGIIIFSIASTLIIESIKVFVLRHFIDVIIKTLGILFIISNMVTFFLTSLLITDVYFIKNKLLTLFIFTLVFSLIKFLLIILLQRIIVKDERENNNYDELDKKE